MNQVNWNGQPLKIERPSIPHNLHETIFDYLPPPIPVTPVIESMAHQYESGDWMKTPQQYGPMQAAAFIRPRSPEVHRERRHEFSLRSAEAQSQGFSIPDIFRRLVQTDAWVDRLHHNTIWLEMPEELWRLPDDPSRLVFLAFVEGHAGCGWHLLLAEDGTHTIMFCEYPFGVRSNWPGGAVPDYHRWKVQQCANSIEEWLYHYFLDCVEHDRHYLERLQPYLSQESNS